MSDGRLFVTGATGFVGRSVLAALPDSPFATAVCLARDPARLPFVDGLEIVPVTGDLTQPEAWAGEVAGADAVLHLAALTGKARRRAHMHSNVDGTRAVVDACRAADIDRFLFVSSVAAGFPDRKHYAYGDAKLAAEHLVAGSGLAHAIARPTIVAGRESPVMVGLLKLATAPFVPVFGSGGVRVQPVHVDDLARDLVAWCGDGPMDGTVRTLGGRDVVTLEELLVKLRVASGKGPGPVVHLPLGFTRACLALVEPLLLPVMPLTAGHLATFANDGLADVSSDDPERRGVDDLVAEAVA